MKPSSLPVLLAVSAAMALPVCSQTAPEALDGVYGQASRTAGVVVHLGCEDPTAITNLRPGPKRLVLALDRDADVVQQCRESLAERGALGHASVALLRGKRLPLPERSVNAIVAFRSLGIEPAEMQRVLVPGGVLYLNDGASWRVNRKPKTDDIDGWTHFLYDSTNNAVSRDRVVAPAERLQWTDGPLWTRSHDFLSSFAVAVSDGGRLFSIEDEAPVASAILPPRWMLVCRDAFNGVILWKRELTDWFDSRFPMRSGPNYLLRRLVAAEGKVFVTLGLHAPVSILDASSGKTMRTLDGTEHTEEILHRDGRLYLVINPDPENASAEYYASRLKWIPLPTIPKVRKTLLAIDATTGEEVWRKSDGDTSPIIEMTLAVDDKRAVYATTRALICLERDTGKLLWRAPRAVERRRPTWSVPTLVLYKDVVLCGDRTPAPQGSDVDREVVRALANGNVPAEVTAYDSASGAVLWSCPSHDGYHFPVEIFVENDRVWTGAVAYSNDPGYTQARNYRTGEVVFERQRDPIRAVGHHRCHRNKATARFITMGRGFLEWVDLAGGNYISNVFLRGSCSFGYLPANGLLYAPPDPCICGTDYKMRGFCAVAGGRTPDSGWLVSEPELQRGPGFGSDGGSQETRSAADWPVYRHDGQRSGVTPLNIKPPLRVAWERKLPGGRVTAPTVSAGKIVLAAIDAHTLYCLDAQTGEQRWRFVTGGRIDTPPTLHDGRALFGARDGFLYSVDLETGALVWSLDLNPGAPRIHAFGQLESVQPLNGSVLVHEDHIYALSGRCSLLDGGLGLFKVRAADGVIAARRRLTGKSGSIEKTDALLPDLLSGASDGFYLRNRKFSYTELADLRRPEEHLWSPVGFLDHQWHHRNYWIYGRQWGRTWPLKQKRIPVPAGRLLCVDAGAGIVFGFGRNRYGWGINPGSWQSGQRRYQLHATPIRPAAPEQEPNVRRGVALPRTPLWSIKPGIEVRAMAVAGRHVVVAGPRGDPVLSERAARGEEGATLQVYERTQGRRVQEVPLPSMPAFDGLAVADGCVFVTLQDGGVVCLTAPVS